MSDPAYPQVVSTEEWQRERAALLVAEKEVTRAADRLAAQRRRLPMTAVRGDYVFTGPDGEVTLLGLFGDQPQLALYQFMDIGPDALCPGCTYLTDNLPALDALRTRGVAWATVSDMPPAQIERAVAEHGWAHIPFYSARDNGLSAELGPEGGFRLSVFLRRGDEVYRTYTAEARGTDRLVWAQNILDVAPWGRQEDWEDSPAGWPQHPTYG